MKKNCPNCGAPIRGRRCNFCGTLFGKDETGNPTQPVQTDEDFILLLEIAIEKSWLVCVCYKPLLYEYDIEIYPNNEVIVTGTLRECDFPKYPPWVVEFLRKRVG